MISRHNHGERRSLLSQIICPLLAVGTFIVLLDTVPRSTPPGLIHEQADSVFWLCFHILILFAAPILVYLMARYFLRSPTDEKPKTGNQSK